MAIIGPRPRGSAAKLARFALAFVATVAIAGCGMNRVRPVTENRPLLPLLRPSIVIVGLDATLWEERNMGITLSRVHEDGQVVGRCLMHDHLKASLPPQRSGRRYFSFTVPPGLYGLSRWSMDVCNGSGFCRSNGLSEGAWPRAFWAPPGRVVYVGDYSAVSYDKIGFSRDLEAARRWSAGRFYELPDLAKPSLSTPGALAFLCTP